MDGKMNADGSWEAANGSKFRSLTAAEVADAVTVFDLIRAAALSRGASLDLVHAMEDEP